MKVARWAALRAVKLVVPTALQMAGHWVGLKVLLKVVRSVGLMVAH